MFHASTNIKELQIFISTGQREIITVRVLVIKNLWTVRIILFCSTREQLLFAVAWVESNQCLQEGIPLPALRMDPNQQAKLFP